MQLVQISTLVIKDVNVKTNGHKIINYVLVPSEHRTIIPDLITLDNLERLGLIKINEGVYFKSHKELCENAFNSVKNYYKAGEEGKIDYTQAIFEITSMGKIFIEVCTR